MILPFKESFFSLQSLNANQISSHEVLISHYRYLCCTFTEIYCYGSPDCHPVLLYVAYDALEDNTTYCRITFYLSGIYPVILPSHGTLYFLALRFTALRCRAFERHLRALITLCEKHSTQQNTLDAVFPKSTHKIFISFNMRILQMRDGARITNELRFEKSSFYYH